MSTLKQKGKNLVLSFQHMFAMLGATITVPMLTGMSIPLALISAGIGTLLFYLLTKKKVPVFLGSSFAFLPGLLTIVNQPGYEKDALLLAAMIAVFIAGMVYVAFSFIIKFVGVEKIKKLFPPIVVGPVIIVIGMNLAGSMFWNNIVLNTVIVGKDSVSGLVNSLTTSADAWKHWTTAIITALTIIGINSYVKPKSFFKVIPILIGFIVGYVYGACVGIANINFSGDIIIFQQASTVWGFWGAWDQLDSSLLTTALLAIVPIAIVSFMEHLGDISANSTVCGKDFMVDPGLHRTVLGDGIATSVSALLGGPANTTYGENTAVLAITKNYNPRNVALAACWAILLGMVVLFGELLSGMPASVVGGACVVLFGMIAANGLRALVDGKVDFANSKNMIVVATTLSVGLGLGALALAGDAVSFLSGYAVNGNVLKIGFATAGGGFVAISSLAISTLLAIVLNLIIPDMRETTEESKQAYNNATVTLQGNVVDLEDQTK